MSISQTRPQNGCHAQSNWRAEIHPTDSGSVDFEYLRPVNDTFAHTLSATEFVVAERLMYDYADVFLVLNLILVAQMSFLTVLTRVTRGRLRSS